MGDPFDGVPGERLAGEAYWEQFDRDFWRVGESGTWKLERLQTFQEPDDESWIALSDGDWSEALRLIDASYVDLQAEYQKITQHGIRPCRVRVAEKPITPYLQWEFYIFRQRQRVGENIRVIGPDQITHLERDHLFPEIVTLGEVMYEIWYDESGLQKGGIRFADRDLTSRYSKIIQDLYSEGEDLESFFDREIAILDPPIVSA